MKVDTRRPLGAIDNLRRIRHRINYTGYRATIAQAEDAVELANACFFAIKNNIEESISI